MHRNHGARRRAMRLSIGAGVVAATLILASAGATAAVDTGRPSRTIVGVGSDNTYEVMNDLDQLYNESPGCAVIPAPGGSFTNFRQLCLSGGSLTYSTNPADLIESENLYHDRVVEAFPVGSGNGRQVLTQFTLNGENTALPSDFSRASSKQTFAVSGFTAYGIAFAKDATAYWVGSDNVNVAQSSNGKPNADISIDDLKNVFIGNADGQCLVNWSKSKGDSVADKFGAPGAGSIDVFAVQTGSGTGTDFARKIDPANAGTIANAAPLANCVPAAAKDGSGGDDHVIFENNAVPICDVQGKDFSSTAIYPYGFGRFIQNRGSTGPCPGTLGAVDGIKPSVKSIGASGAGAFPLAAFRYNYFLVPDGVNVNNPGTWSGQLQSVLSYLHPTLGWLCKTSHANDPVSGANYRARIEKSLRSDGYAPLTNGPVGGTTFTGNSFCRDSVAT
jgi:ABC-type phosphate transport system substrate-binding protein